MRWVLLLMACGMLLGCPRPFPVKCDPQPLDYRKKPSREILRLTPQATPAQQAAAYEHDAAEWPLWADYLEKAYEGLR